MKMSIVSPCLLILLMILFPALADARPAIEFAQEEHSLGKVHQGMKVSHTFELINKGNGDLVIKKLAPS